MTLKRARALILPVVCFSFLIYIEHGKKIVVRTPVDHAIHIDRTLMKCKPINLSYLLV